MHHLRRRPARALRVCTAPAPAPRSHAPLVDQGGVEYAPVLEKHAQMRGVAGRGEVRAQQHDRTDMHRILL